MKKSLIFACLLLCNSAIAKTTNLYDLQTITRQQIPKLYYQLSDHFQRFNSATVNDTPTLEAMKDKNRQQQLYQLYRVLGLAIDEQYSLQDLTPLGITQIDDRHFQIDLNRHPRWASLGDLAIPLSGELNPVVASDLIQRGFQQKDVAILKQYLQAHKEYPVTLKANLTFIKEVVPTLLNQPSQTPDLAEAYQLLKQFNKHQAMAEEQRMLDILELFDSQRQRILMSYLQERLGTKAIGSAPLSPEGLMAFATNIVSEKFKLQIQSAIATQESNQ